VPRPSPNRAAAPPPASAPPPPPKPAAPSRALGLGEFLCECGEIQPPRTSRTGKDFTCKKCGRKGSVEVDKDPQTGAVRMRPVFKSGPTVPEAPPPQAASAAAPGPLDELGEVSFEMLAPIDPFDEIFESAAGPSRGDAPPTVEADAQIVPCECGAELLLSTNDIGRTIQCPACADTMNVEQKGKKITLRLVSALETTDWKLEEFQ